MPSPLRCPSRDDAVLELYTLFRRAGFEGVSIADISEATGLGRSSLYHYFPGGKADMAAAVLSFAHNCVQRTVIAALKGPGPVHERLERMLEAVHALYEGGAEPCIIASMMMGTPDALLQTRVDALLAEWLEALGQLLEENGLPGARARQRAALIIGRIEGGLLLSRALGQPQYFADALACVRTEAWAG